MKSDIRTAVVKIAELHSETSQWYDDLQVDYKRYMPMIYSWIKIGYLQEINEQIIITTPEEAATKLQSTIKSKEILNLIERFVVSYIHGSQQEASSSYSLFYQNYSGRDQAKLSKNRILFLQKGEYEDKSIKSLKLDLISREDWLVILQKTKGKTDSEIKSVWDGDLGRRVVDQNRCLGGILRDKLNIVCCRPQDKVYCSTLAEILRRSIKSQLEKYNAHLLELDTLKTTVEEFQNESEFKLLLEFAENLNQQNYGLSRYVLNNAIKAIEGNKPSNVQVAADILKQSKYQPILALGYKQQNVLYYRWRAYSRYNERKTKKPYPFAPRLDRDYKIPIGNTSLGSFAIQILNNRSLVTINGNINICLPSNYLSNLKINEVRDGKRIIGYKAEFNHRSKRSSRQSPLISGEIKEIGLQKKGNEYFISFYCNVASEKSQQTENIGYFFKTAAPKTIELPESMNVLGVDLNISNPVSGALVKISKQSGNFPVRDYGYGTILKNEFLAADGKRCGRLIKLKKECKDLKTIIYCYKDILKGKVLSEKNEELLNKLSKIRLSSKMKQYCDQASLPKKTRALIQTKFAKIGHLLRRCKFEMGSAGNLAEMMRLLDAIDAYASLTSSYERIHLKSNEQMLAKPKLDLRRANLRLYISRRIAACIAQYCVQNQVSVCFVEDLNSKQDSDNDNNSLIRLFSAKTLLNCIEQALKKINVAYVEVDKRGTSQTNPLTGDFAYREKKIGKEKLGVLIKNQPVFVDSDLAAAINIVKKGLDRSITPYKFYARNNAEEENRKRIAYFLKSKFNVEKVYFYENQDGTLDAETKNRKSANPYVGHVYYRSRTDCFLTEKAHRQERDCLEQLFTDKSVTDQRLVPKKLPKFDLTPCLKGS